MRLRKRNQEKRQRKFLEGIKGNWERLDLQPLRRASRGGCDPVAQAGRALGFAMTTSSRSSKEHSGSHTAVIGRGLGIGGGGGLDDSGILSEKKKTEGALMTRL